MRKVSRAFFGNNLCNLDLMGLPHANYIDILFLVIIFLSVWAGYRRGFISGAFGLLTLLVSAYAAFSLYPYTARFIQQYLFQDGSWSLPFAFFVTLAGVGLVLSLAANFILGAVPREVHENGFNKFLGIFPGLCNGILWSALLATILLVLPLADSLSESARHSQVTSVLAEEVSRAENAIVPVLRKHVRPLMTSLTVAPGAEETVRLSFRVREPVVVPDLENQMLVLINKERGKAGLEPLTMDASLTKIARQHSFDMFDRSYFSHQTPEGLTPFQRMEVAGIHYEIAGENIALAPTLMTAHEGLMHSPGHRANILRPSFTAVGIGILDGGKYGLMVTQDFTK